MRPGSISLHWLSPLPVAITRSLARPLPLDLEFSLLCYCYDYSRLCLAAAADRPSERASSLFLRRPPSGRRLKVIPSPSSVPSKSDARPPPHPALPRPDERAPGNAR